MQIALPHMLDLGEMVVISVDGEPAASLPYKFCNQAACFVLIDANTKLFETFRKGNKGQIQATAVNGSRVNLNFSLSGFSAALASLPLNQNP